MRTLKSKKSVELAEKWIIAFAKRKLGYMITSNIEAVTYLESKGLEKFSKTQINYWVSQFAKYTAGDVITEYLSGNEYPITSACFIRCVDILGLNEFEDWAMKEQRAIFTEYYLTRQNSIYLFLLLRNTIINSNIVFKTLLLENIVTPTQYSSTTDIATYIFALTRCQVSKEKKSEIKKAKDELIRRQKQDGSWDNFITEVESSLNEEEAKSQKHKIFCTCCAIHALFFLDNEMNKRRLKKAVHWLISQQDYEGCWSSPNGSDVALFTGLCLDSLDLVDGYLPEIYRKENKIMVTNSMTEKNVRKEYDVFISHSNTDKIEYVDGLVKAIKRLDIRIFYDKEVISWGDNWKDVIMEGISKSEFAIIVISNNFFDREWTEKELNEFLRMQNSSKQKIILPLLHNIDYEKLKSKYPALQFIHGFETTKHSKNDVTFKLASELIKRYKKLEF